MARNTTRIKRKKPLWISILSVLAVLLLVAWAVWLIWARLHLEEKMSHFLGKHSMTAEKTQVDWLGRYVLSNVRIAEAGSVSPVIGEVRGQLSLLADDYSMQARNIRYEFPRASVLIPEMQVEQARLREVPLTGKDRLSPPVLFPAAGDARKVVIPEITVLRRNPVSERQTSYQDITFQNIELHDIAAGRIGLLKGRSAVRFATSGSMAASGGDDAPLVELAVGPFEVHDVNAALWEALFLSESQPVDAGASDQQLYGRYSIRNIVSLPLSDDAVKYYIEELSGDGLSLQTLRQKTGRRVKGGRTETIPATSSHGVPVGVLEALGPFRIDVKGFTLSNLSGVETSFDRARFDYDGAAADLVFDNVRITHASTTTAFAGLILEKVRLPKFMDTVREISASPSGGVGCRSVGFFTRLDYACIPQFAAVRVNGMTVDREEQGGAAVRILGLENLDVRAEHRRGVVPTGLRVNIEKLQLPVNFFEGRGLDPQTPHESYLRALGYGSLLNSDLIIDLRWDEAEQQIELKEFSTNVDDLGSFRLWGTIGNVTETFFMDSPLALAIAATGLRIREIHLKTDKDGLWQRLVARRSGQTGQSPEEIRSQRIISVREMLSRASSRGAEAVISLEPVFDYLKTDGVLTVDAVAKNAHGVGVYEFLMDTSDPYRWFEYFNLRADLKTDDRRTKDRGE